MAPFVAIQTPDVEDELDGAGGLHVDKLVHLLGGAAGNQDITLLSLAVKVLSYGQRNGSRLAHMSFPALLF